MKTIQRYPGPHPSQLRSLLARTSSSCDLQPCLDGSVEQMQDDSPVGLNAAPAVREGGL